jgi:hypothetical protein
MLLTQPFAQGRILAKSHNFFAQQHNLFYTAFKKIRSKGFEKKNLPGSEYTYLVWDGRFVAFYYYSTKACI